MEANKDGQSKTNAEDLHITLITLYQRIINAQNMNKLGERLTEFLVKTGENNLDHMKTRKKFQCSDCAVEYDIPLSLNVLVLKAIKE